jgi:dolichyldiphosphatase
MSSSPLVPFDFFYVLVDPADLFAPLFAFLTFSPFLIGFAQLTAVIGRRDFHSALLLAGLLMGTIISSGLKEIIKQPRPPNSFKLGYGMPSDHAQFMTFLFFYTWLMRRLYKHNENKPIYINFTELGVSSRLCSFLNSMFDRVQMPLLFIFCLSVIYSRLYFSVHTIQQLAAGTALGAINSFIFVQFLHSRHSSGLLFIDYFLSSSLARALYLKDSWRIQNFQSKQFQWYKQQIKLDKQEKEQKYKLNSK